MNKIVQLKDITKAFGNNIVLEHANLEVQGSEIVGIVGHNGCGKSVLYKIICGLMAPNKGEVIVNGINIERGKFPENIGIMLDNTDFIPYYSGFKNLKDIAIIDNKVDDSEIKECMKQVGLDPDNKKPIKTYSLGMKQRLKFALAIMENPNILLLDEPFNAVDSEMKDVMKNILQTLNREKHVTIMLTSHIEDDLKNLCNRMIKIHNKKFEDI